MDSSSYITQSQTTIKSFQPNFQSGSNPCLRFLCFSHLISHFIRLNKKLQQIPQDQHRLTIQDIPNIKYQFSTQYVSTRLQQSIQDYFLQYGNIDPTSMFLILYKTFKKDIILLLIFATFQTILRLVTSILIQLLIEQFIQKNSKTIYIYTILFILCLFSKSVFLNNFYYYSYFLNNKIKACFAYIITKKVSTFSQYTIKNTQIATIINMLSSDLITIQNKLTNLFKALIFPIIYIFCAIIMYHRLGICGLICIAFPLFTLLIQIFLGKLNGNHINISKSFKDQRIQLTNQAIQGIRLTKLYGWEDVFNKKIRNYRKKQISQYILINLNQSVQNAISAVSGYWGILSAMKIISLRGSITLSSAKILSALDLIFYFNTQYANAVLGFNFYFQLKVIFSRFVSIYKIENIVLRKIDQQLYPQKNKQQNTKIQIGQILFKNFNGYWSKNIQKPSLRNINIFFQKSKFYGITGKVGSGKSGLLSVIIKQIPYYSGTFQMQGDVAYVQQQPFIFAGTAKYNIIFGKQYDQQFYHQVIKACCLESDFNIFPKGDETVIGERGITISGGQKARLALARAVYSRSDIYLLDDPISAVDAKVARRIYNNVITGMLKGKTILLVTHQINYIRQCDSVLIMEQGKIKHSGTPNQLKDQLIKLSIRQDNNINCKNSSPTLSQDITQNKIDHVINKGEYQQVVVKFQTYIRYFSYHKIKSLILITFVLFLIAQLFSVIFLRIFALIDDVISNQSFISSFSIYLMLLVGISMLIFIFTLVKIFLLSYLILRSNQNMHNDMVDSTLRVPIQYFDSVSTGAVLSRFSNDIGNIDSEMNVYILEQANTLFNLLFVIINVFVTLPIYIPLGLIHIALVCYYCYYSYRIFSETKILDAKEKVPILQNIQAIINGIIHLNIYKQNQQFNHKMINLIDNSTRANNNHLLIGRAFNISIIYFSFIFYVFAIFVGLKFIQTPALYGIMVINLLQMTSNLYYSASLSLYLQALMINVVRIQNMINLKPQPRLRTQYDEQIGFKQQIQNEKNNKPNFKIDWPQQATIEFKHFDMRYKEQLDPVLIDLNFYINDGEKVGIVGRTGAGKSSIIQALFRMTEGQQHSQIFIGGYTIKNMGLRSLRGSISIIPQIPFLFQGTIRDNLDPMQQESQENIWLALQESDLKKYVQSLPQMLDTDISNVNQIFSAGQKQLMCLARAILRKNKILVLDEATSNVDMRTDDFIQKTLKTKFKDQTIITIAHRLTTIADYDRVIVMDKGRIVQNGKPFDLLVQNKSDNWITKKGLFAEMVLSTGQNAKLIFELIKQNAQK